MSSENKHDAERQLQTLRQRIRILDSEMLKLAKERLDCAHGIAAAKLALDLPIKDYQVEKEVIDRNRTQATQLGLYEDLASELTTIMIRYAVQAQDEYHARQRGSVTTQKQIGIVGGLGKMGRWLGDFFGSFGHAITIYDQASSASDAHDTAARSLTELCQKCNVIVLATPITATGAYLEQLATLQPKALIFDICSLKSPIIDSLRHARQRGLRVTSIHPMFGPNTRLLAGRNILFCTDEDASLVAEARELFADTTANLHEVPLTEHDRLMSYVLGMSHITNLIFGDAMVKSGISYETLQQVASTSFAAQLAVVRPIVDENQDLYYEIQAENHHTDAVFAALATSTNAYRQCIQQRDRSGFRQLMESSRRYLHNIPASTPSGSTPD